MSERRTYTRRTDGATMIEVEPHCYVSLWPARQFDLISYAEYDAIDRAADAKRQARETAA